MKWHDGQPFTAADAKFSYDLYMNPETGTPRAGTLNEHIASVVAKDPQTVVFTLKDVIKYVQNSIKLTTKPHPRKLANSFFPKNSRIPKFFPESFRMVNQILVSNRHKLFTPKDVTK